MIRVACIVSLMAGGAAAQTLPEGLAGLGGSGDGPILQPTSAAPAPVPVATPLPDPEPVPEPGSAALPEGLAGLGGGSDGPVLQPTSAAPPADALPLDVPQGLESAATDSALPETPPETPISAEAPATGGLRVSGFTELRYGARLNDDALQGDATLSELRFNLNIEAGREVVWTLNLDTSLDDVVADGGAVYAALDAPFVREANVFFRLGPSVDVRLGRQIITWGTGDLVSVNDVFPQDQVSFFAGRDDTYLRAPVDALRISGFSDLVNADLAVLAPGQTDLFITGERLTYTNPANGQPTNASPAFVRPDGAEYALRLYRTFGSFEGAAYAYRGHWQSPAGQDAAGRLTFPELEVYGVSVRGPVLGGIGYAEIGQYNSQGDPDGTNPMVANSQLRWLLGYEREVARNTTLGLQYMQTRMEDHASYLAGLPAGGVAAPETRDLATLRLTRLMLNQTLTASAFLFHSPSQDDGHLRLSLDYDVTDDWNIGAYATRFYGDADTPFGQFEDASSFGISVRYSF